MTTTDLNQIFEPLTSTSLASVTGYTVNGTDLNQFFEPSSTWTQQTNAGSRNWYSIASSSDGTKLAACVRPGYIYTSTNSGVTWAQQTNAGSRNWYSIASSSDGTKLAALVNDGYIYTYLNNSGAATGYTVNGTDLNQIFQPLTSTSTAIVTRYNVLL